MEDLTANNTINARAVKVISEFEQFKDWESKYKYLIALGKQLPDLDLQYKTDAFKVKGCQSQVWLVPRFEDGLVKFSADSDASITKGIVALLVTIYSNSPAHEILSFKPDFIDKIGLRQHLSMSRANGLTSMFKQILYYGMAFKAQV